MRAQAIAIRQAQALEEMNRRMARMESALGIAVEAGTFGAGLEADEGVLSAEVGEEFTARMDQLEGKVDQLLTLLSGNPAPAVPASPQPAVVEPAPVVEEAAAVEETSVIDEAAGDEPETEEAPAKADGPEYPTSGNRRRTNNQS